MKSLSRSYLLKDEEGLKSAVASVDQELTEAPGAGAWWRQESRSPKVTTVQTGL